MSDHSPATVIPAPLASVVHDLSWFVIGGHAVRCFCPYRPSHDVDFGVATSDDLEALVSRLESSGNVEIQERSHDTVHLRWNDIVLSIFLLENLAPYVEDGRLDVTGILATKTHAILDRGTRRDFFDLYVILQHHQLGIVQCLAAIREVYQAAINDGLLLRALTYFDDAEREAPLQGEGRDDWKDVKDFFMTRVGHLLVPPAHALSIQSRKVDLNT